MRTLHLCCGRGGSLWAGAILGWEAIAAVDNNAWRVECLRRESVAGWWPRLQAICADILSDWHATIHGRVDCIAAGFSCRDISAAGEGAGLDGKSTGPTYAGVLRAIDYFRPKYVFLENSPNIRTKGRVTVTRNFVERGYRYRDGVISASDVGAPHIRDRWYFLAANADGVRELQQHRGELDQWGRIGDGAAPSPANALGEQRRPNRPGRNNPGGDDPRWKEADHINRNGTQNAANALCNRLQIAVQRGGLSSAAASTIEAAARYCGTYHWNSFDHELLRVVDGLSIGRERDVTKRIAALGDAWVPLQAAAAWISLSR